MDEIELPTMEARRWIADAARECGYPDELAEILGYSAWWLENRNMGGVLRTVTYLLLIHGTPFSDLKPKAREKGLLCLCPLMCGELLATRAEDDAASFSDWTGGFATADPVLMAPVIARYLDYRFDLFLRFHDQELMFTEKGATILSESLATLCLLDTDDGVETAIRLVEPGRNTIPADFAYARRDSLLVPRYRYLDGGGFRFD